MVMKSVMCAAAGAALATGLAWGAQAQNQRSNQPYSTPAARPAPPAPTGMRAPIPVAGFGRLAFGTTTGTLDTGELDARINAGRNPANFVDSGDDVDIIELFLNAGGGVMVQNQRGFGMQYDVEVETTSDLDDGDVIGTIATQQLHFFLRRPQIFAASVGGGFASGTDDLSLDVGTGFAEAAFFTNRYSTRVTAAYSSFDKPATTMTGVRVGVDYFANANTRLGGHVVLGESDSFGNYDRGLLWRVGADVERRLRNSPLSLFAALEHASVDDGLITDTTLRLGGRVAYGAPTLYEEDRKGASFKGGSFLLDTFSVAVGRAAGGSDATDEEEDEEDEGGDLIALEGL